MRKFSFCLILRGYARECLLHSFCATGVAKAFFHPVRWSHKSPLSLFFESVFFGKRAHIGSEHISIRAHNGSVYAHMIGRFHAMQMRGRASECDALLDICADLRDGHADLLHAVTVADGDAPVLLL